MIVSTASVSVVEAIDAERQLSLCPTVVLVAATAFVFSLPFRRLHWAGVGVERAADGT